MGCESSKSIEDAINLQENKIQHLIEMNKELQSKLNALIDVSMKQGEPAEEITELKNRINVRFENLEKAIEKIENDVNFRRFVMATDRLDDPPA